MAVAKRLQYDSSARIRSTRRSKSTGRSGWAGSHGWTSTLLRSGNGTTSPMPAYLAMIDNCIYTNAPEKQRVILGRGGNTSLKPSLIIEGPHHSVAEDPGARIFFLWDRFGIEEAGNRRSAEAPRP